jgi:hypothetical protein
MVIAQTLLLPLAGLHGALIHKIAFDSVAILTMKQPSLTGFNGSHLPRSG